MMVSGENAIRVGWCVREARDEREFVDDGAALGFDGFFGPGDYFPIRFYIGRKRERQREEERFGEKQDGTFYFSSSSGGEPCFKVI